MYKLSLTNIQLSIYQINKSQTLLVIITLKAIIQPVHKIFLLKNNLSNLYILLIIPYHFLKNTTQPISKVITTKIKAILSTKTLTLSSYCYTKTNNEESTTYNYILVFVNTTFCC